MLDPLPPKLAYGPQLVQALSEADRALGELAGLGRTLPNPYLLTRPFLRREAVLSSRIEGTQASLVDLYAFEVEPPLFGEPERRDDVQVSRTTCGRWSTVWSASGNCRSPSVSCGRCTPS